VFSALFSGHSKCPAVFCDVLRFSVISHITHTPDALLPVVHNKCCNIVRLTTYCTAHQQSTNVY